MENAKIILITDLLDSKARKEKELIFYQEELRRLEERMSYLRLEIKLTNDIIRLIENEKIQEIKK